MILLAANEPEMVVKPWALLPLGALSLGIAWLYYRVFLYGMNSVKLFIAAKEVQYHVIIQFRRWSMTIIGKISPTDSLRLHLQIFLVYFTATIAPIIMLGSLIFIIPESWWHTLFEYFRDKDYKPGT